MRVPDRATVAAVAVVWLGYVLGTLVPDLVAHRAQAARTAAAAPYLLTGLVAVVIVGGYVVVRVRRTAAEEPGAGARTWLTLVVPAYAEHPEVVRRRLWAAALRDHSDVRVVLLIDDPWTVARPDVASRLAHTSRLASGISRLLETPRRRVEEASAALEKSLADRDSRVDPVADTADVYLWAATWLEDRRAKELRAGPASHDLSDQLDRLARDLGRTGRWLRAASETGADVDAARLRELHQRLRRIFRADLRTFERTSYLDQVRGVGRARSLDAVAGTRPPPAADFRVTRRLWQTCRSAQSAKQGSLRGLVPGGSAPVPATGGTWRRRPASAGSPN